VCFAGAENGHTGQDLAGLEVELYNKRVYGKHGVARFIYLRLLLWL